MMAALCILCASLSAIAPEPAVVQAGGGVFGLLPAATLRAEAPVGAGVVTLRYDTAGALVHDLALGGRLGGDAWRVELDVAHGFVGIEEIAGIQLDDIPFGQGLTSTATGLYALRTAGGHRVQLGGGLTARWTTIETTLGTQERVFEPTLHHVHGEVRVDWTGGLFLRARAIVPIQAELKIIGYWPQVLVGRAWAL